MNAIAVKAIIERVSNAPFLDLYTGLVLLETMRAQAETENFHMELTENGEQIFHYKDEIKT